MFSKKFKQIGCILSAIIIATVFVGCSNSKPIITLDKRNGEPLERIEVPYVGAETYKSGSMLFPNPIRKGWFFNGWFLDEQCTQSAYGVHIKSDTTFYADWVDSITVPFYTPTWLISEDYSELFTVSSTVEPYAPAYGLPRYKLTLSVTPTGDFTGENSTDRIEIQVTHYWLSDEKFLDEYVSEEIEAYVAVRVWLQKDKGYALHNEVIIESYNNNSFEYPIYPSTFLNRHTKTAINYIFSEPTLQYKH